MVFLALLLILGLATVVGHGLWLLFAALIRELARDPGATRSQKCAEGPAQRCPGCGVCWIKPSDQACPSCGLLQPGRRGLATQQGEIDAALRQIRGLLARGELDPATAEHLGTLLESRRRVLRGEIVGTPAFPARQEDPQTEPAVPEEIIPAVLPWAEPVQVPQPPVADAPGSPHCPDP